MLYLKYFALYDEYIRCKAIDDDIDDNSQTNNSQSLGNNTNN